MAWANASDHAPEPAPTSRILWIGGALFWQIGDRRLGRAKFPGKMLATQFGEKLFAFLSYVNSLGGAPLFTTSVRSFQASQVSDIAWAIAPI